MAQRMCRDYPLASRAVVGLARDEVRRELRKWGIRGETAEDVTMVVSEYVTNCILHVGDGPIRLTVELTGGAVHVSVSDTSPVPPIPEPSPDLGGRGPHIVAALTGGKCGYRLDRVGKTVFATIPIPQDPASVIPVKGPAADSGS